MSHHREEVRRFHERARPSRTTEERRHRETYALPRQNLPIPSPVAWDRRPRIEAGRSTPAMTCGWTAAPSLSRMRARIPRRARIPPSPETGSQSRAAPRTARTRGGGWLTARRQLPGNQAPECAGLFRVARSVPPSPKGEGSVKSLKECELSGAASVNPSRWRATSGTCGPLPAQCHSVIKDGVGPASELVNVPRRPLCTRPRNGSTRSGDRQPRRT
jgi:hypothetical protein